LPTIQTRTHLDKLLKFVREAKVVIVDTETTGLKPWEDDRLIGIGIGLEAKHEFYLPFRHDAGLNLSIEWLPEVLDALAQAGTLVAHNIKFDLAMLYQDGYRAPVTQRFEDTMSAARLCEPDRYAKLGLTPLLEKYLGAEYAAYDHEFVAALRALKLTKRTMQASPIDLCGKYCENDVQGTRSLRQIFNRILRETEQWSLWQQEVDTTRALWEMEATGVGFNKVYGEYIVPILEQKIELIKGELNTLAGQEFNPNSTPQLGKVMANLGLHSPKTGKSGAACWEKEVLELFEHKHPLPKKLLELRSIQKVCGTDIRPRLERGLDVLHEEIKPFGAITGRMSSGLHTFPRDGIMVHDEVVSPRNLIIPRDGYDLYFADYSQMEMRVFADYMGDPGLLKKIEAGGLDYHDLVAKEVWHVDESDPDWKEFRRKAKAINFGLVYGIGDKKLSADLGVSLSEGREYKREYFERMPRAEPFIRMVGKIAEARGYVRNRFNRRYWIDPHRVYVAVNYLVQGTSADLMKNRIVAIQNYIWANRLKSRMLLQVHDEVIFEVHKSETQFFVKKVHALLEERLLTVKLAVDISIGNPGWGSKLELAWCSTQDRYHSKKEHRELCVH
jgi:DNA polymerase-1